MHIQLRPGSDVAMALAAELERRDALHKKFIAEWTTGFDAYMEEARKYSVADVNTICGAPTAQFNQLADWYVASDNAAASFGNGIERGRSGGSGLRAAMALQALTGNHGRLGAGVIAKSGDRIGIEDPGYAPLHRFVKTHSLQPVYMKVDEQGANLPDNTQKYVMDAAHDGSYHLLKV